MRIHQRFFHRVGLLTLFFGLLVSRGFASERQVLFDQGWRFFRGAANAEAPTFDDSSWRTVDLPHDWSIEPLPGQQPDKVVGPFSRDSVGKSATGETVGGEGWYRKTFVIPAEDAGKRYELYFEGVYNQSEVWINGHKASENVYGYTAFRFDITPFCNPPGTKNVVAVKVVNSGRNSRWYAGSGIYRHVWLVCTQPSHLEDWGAFITTTALRSSSADVSLNATIVNGESAAGTYEVGVSLLSPTGAVVATATQAGKVDALGKLAVPFALTVANPSPWSPDSPALYTARITLAKAGRKLDEISVPFGIRTIHFSAERGFELNGVSLKLKGGCVHHDNGLLGAEAFDDAETRKVELLKQNGFNAIRTSHNPVSDSFLAACDRLGMLVIAESFDQWNVGKTPQDYHLYFKDWSARDIRALVLRERNHPSIILWSIGNEIPERNTDQGVATAEYLKNEILKYDATRPITAAVDRMRDKQGKDVPLDQAFQTLDVAGYNYMWDCYENDHPRFPARVMFGTESFPREAAQNWDLVEKHPYVIGDFVWTAMDYLGEAGLGSSMDLALQKKLPQFMGWPWFGAWSGDLDLLGVKKPQSYYRDIVWGRRAISMAVETLVAAGKVRKITRWGWPDESLAWTFPGQENTPLRVNVYTRAPRVRLYLNGTVVGEKGTDKLFKAAFDVPYKAGTLKAVEVDASGHEGEVVVLETVGAPAVLRVTIDRRMLRANGQDLAYALIELVDAKGRVILGSDQAIKISITGAGKIIGSGNGSPDDMASFGSLTPRLFHGRAMAIIRAGYAPGEIKLDAASDGLPTAAVTLESR